MKKVLCILTLLCAVCTGAWAQETVAGLKVSGTPENGQWSSNTTWYYMAMRWNNAINYLSSGSEYISGNELKVNNQTPDRTDNGKWCIVKNGEGYSFYNKAKGTGYAITTSNNKICISETSTPTVYSIPDKKNNQNSVSSWFIRDGVSGNNYWDSNGASISHWNSGDAYGNNNGSVYFINAYEDGDKIYLKNKQHEFYIGVRESDNAIEGKASKSDATAWEIKHHEGKIVLKDGSSYMGKVPTTHDTHNSLTSSIDEAEHFSIELNTSGYYVLRLSTSCSSDNNTSHIFLHGVSWSENDGRGINLTTVRWASDANASQWSIEDYTPEGYSEEEINALQTKINGVVASINAGAVGYPNKDADSNSETLNIIKWYTNNLGLEGAGVTGQNYDYASSALSNVYALTDINLPIPGKAYYIKNVHPNGTVYAFKQDGENDLQLVNTNNNELDESSVYVYYKSSSSEAGFQDGFVNSKTGKYLIWKGQSSGSYAYNSNHGYSDNYNSIWCGMKISKPESSAAENMFGLVTFGGKRDGNRANPAFYITNAGVFNAMTVENVTFNDAASTLFRFEEVDNPNKVKLTCPTTDVKDNHGLNGKYVGTFSAPYNVKLSSEVIAYTAEVEGNKVTFNELGNVVPKNIGVLLYAPVAAVAITKDAEPAIENVPDMSDRTNALVGTNGAKLTVDGSVNAYILSKDEEEGVKFYPLADSDRTIARNKAYLVLTASGVTAFRFDFEEEQTTGVEAIEAQQGVKKAYDIAGRSVNASKHGLYIIGGNKVIR